MMSAHEKDLAFLRQCILYDDSAERHKLEETITHGAALSFTKAARTVPRRCSIPPVAGFFNQAGMACVVGGDQNDHCLRHSRTLS